MGNENPSLRARTKNAIERLDALEAGQLQIITAVNQSLGNINSQVMNATEVLDAVVVLVGMEQVQQQVIETRRNRLKEQSDAQVAQIETLKGKGILVVSEKITDKSLLIGKETTKEGEIIFPGRSQLRFSQIDKAIGEKMLGQGIGFTVETPPGGKWEVVEIYEVDEKRSEEVAKEEAAAAAKAQEEVLAKAKAEAEAKAQATATPASEAPATAETTPAPAAEAAKPSLTLVPPPAPEATPEATQPSPAQPQ